MELQISTLYTRVGSPLTIRFLCGLHMDRQSSENELMNPGHFCQIIRSCNKLAALDANFRGLFLKILINVIKFNQKQTGYTATAYVNVI